MKDIYLLRDGSRIICAATRFERCSMEQARFSADEQARQRIDKLNLLEDDD